ncbi:MAG: 2-isopropylmalate synthase [Oscillospiraceae bacterium]|nr:2-isopropylmalate synthase [Oscillospiraceae bacterium]
MNKIYIFDTTLRDGEQVPGAKLNLKEKLRIAKQLEMLNVDFIEAGFPSSSKGDFEAVKAVAGAVVSDSVVVTALARAVKEDIDAVYESVRHAKNPMIHIVLGASELHIKKKFAKTNEQILEMAVESVKYAKKLLPAAPLQYSAEDASRSDFEYLWRTVESVVKAGATIINIPDTVGYAVPEQFGELIKKTNYRLKNLNDGVLLSVHCHNDLGLAAANTLAAVKNGADKAECTINGIGERAGNAALEEVVMGLKVRGDYYGGFSSVETKHIKNTSKLVSSLMGLDVQVNKAITGDNAFAHSSGIHQDGLLKSRAVYEIIDPRDVGIEDMELVLTARSGRAAFRNTIREMGVQGLSEEDFERLYFKFLELADKKKEIYYHDIYYLTSKYFELGEDFSDKTKIYELLNYQVISSDIFPSASVKIKCGEDILTKTATGDGPIDALYTAIKKAADIKISLLDYKISSISQGKEAMGRVRIRVKFRDKAYNSSAADVDTIKASAIALLNCINQINIENGLI